jgi:ABC-type bacteriocin/lantibiotic exporter with double-glycine peptidase domain
MGIAKVWRGFFYFMITIVIIAVVLLLALPFALIFLVIITALAIIGFIIRLIFIRKNKVTYYNQQNYKQQNNNMQSKHETIAKEDSKWHVVDAEIIEYKSSGDESKENSNVKKDNERTGE